MRIPGPWLARFTNYFLRWFEVLDRRQQFIESMHKKHGPVVRLAPRTVSINSIKGLQEVYSVTKKFDRPPLPMFHAYESENLVSTVNAHLHQQRRKPMRRLYARRSVDSNEMQALFRKKAEGLVQYLRKKSQSTKSGDAKLALQSMAAEIMSVVVYGKKFALNVFNDDEQRTRMIVNIKSEIGRIISVSAAISAWFPYFVLRLRRWNLAPYPLNSKLQEDLLMREVATAAFDSAVQAFNEDKPIEHPCLIEVLVNNYAEQLTPEKKNYILSECHDHFWAGVTTAIDGLLALMFQLSLPKNKDKQQRLREELCNLSPGVDHTEVKYLDYVIKESLRLHPPVIGSLDRITTDPITVEGIRITSGTEIGAQAYSLHRNTSVFPEPDMWQPERWAVDSGSDEYRSMNRHLFAFGMGPRMCIGMNAGLSMMRHAVATVYSTFRTSLDEELVADPRDPDGSQEEKSKKWIRGDRCPIRFEALE